MLHLKANVPPHSINMSPPHLDKNTVIITGFGPFGIHTINASWEAVKLLPKMLDADALGIKLVVQEIPVEYQETIKRLSELKEKYKPVLIINVGVSHKANMITLESCAYKFGYDRPDVQGKLPPCGECCIGKEPCISTNLPVEKMAAELNNMNIGVNFCTSADAGLYLCEFSFYTSLCLNEQNSLFIHVPDISNPYTPHETARGLCEIIRLAVAQVHCDETQVSQNGI